MEEHASQLDEEKLLAQSSLAMALELQAKAEVEVATLRGSLGERSTSEAGVGTPPIFTLCSFQLSPALSPAVANVFWLRTAVCPRSRYQHNGANAPIHHGSASFV
jgi:hypothetical protein